MANIAKNVAETTVAVDDIVIAAEFEKLNNALLIGAIKEGEECTFTLESEWYAQVYNLLTGKLKGKQKKEAEDAFFVKSEDQVIKAYKVKVTCKEYKCNYTLYLYRGIKDGRAYNMLEALVRQIYAYKEDKAESMPILVALLKAKDTPFVMTYGTDDNGYNKWFYMNQAKYLTRKAKAAAETKSEDEDEE